MQRKSPNNFSFKVISAAAIALLVCGLVAKADIADAANLEIVGNTTTVSLTSFDFLTGAGFAIAPLNNATVDASATPPDIFFPITGGFVATDTGFAMIEHDNSGFSLEKDSRTVFFENFLIDTEKALLLGDTTVNTTTSLDFPLFVIGDQLELNLTSEAALLLDGVYFIGDLTGAEIGIASLDLQTVPVPGAIWLLGSALIGVVGLKRRKE